MNGAGVHNARVSNSNLMSDDAGKVIGIVKNRVVLNIALGSDFNGVDVSSQGGMIPYTAAFSNRNTTDKASIWSDECRH